MKTPDEIKTGLECCASGFCATDCPYRDECLPYNTVCSISLLEDAAERIHQLEQENAELAARIELGKVLEEQLKRERDAAVEDLKLWYCFSCKNASTSMCDACSRNRVRLLRGLRGKQDNFVWRGVPQEDAEHE